MSHNPMTGASYCTAISLLGLSQQAAGAFFKVNVRTSRRWVVDGPNEQAAMILRYMVEHKVTPAQFDPEWKP